MTDRSESDAIKDLSAGQKRSEREKEQNEKNKTEKQNRHLQGAVIKAAERCKTR